MMAGDFDDDNDDDDDDMLDMFSFGAETTTATTMSITQPVSTGPYSSSSDKIVANNSISISDSDTKSYVHLSVKDYDTNDDEDNDEKSCASNDSFIELLDNALITEDNIVMTATIIGNNRKENNSNSNKNESNNLQQQNDDLDMQDILDWLDDDDDKGRELLQRQEEELVFVRPTTTLEESEPIDDDDDDDDDDKKPKAVSLPPQPQSKEYNSLEEAVKCRESSKDQIRTLLEKENFIVSAHVRPHLWCKVICGKTLEEIIQSSLADSFQQWEEKYWQNYVAIATVASRSSSSSRSSTCSTDTTNQQEEEDEEKHQIIQSTDHDDTPKSQQQISKEQNPQLEQQIPISQNEQQREWLEEQSSILANRIVAVVKDGDFQFYRKSLLTILANHYDTGNNNTIQEGGDSWKDPLLPPIVCCILCAGVPPPVACVMLSQIIPSFMPILALTIEERKRAATILHRQFYLLASYHLPLLVLHLDKYIPDWYQWPPHGHLPQSWLISHLAGETDGTYMNQRWLLRLWDLVLTSSNNSFRFFLVVAILDMHAEGLLFLTGDELKIEFQRVVSFSTNQTEEDVMCDQQANQWVQEWSDRALLFWEETPMSVTRRLKVLEDGTVSETLVARQKAKEEQLRLQQEAEIKALQEAREAEQERKTDEARLRLTRARLVAFYRQYNPGKEDNIDKIMRTYDGRYDVLDAKLKMKYNVGFNPALKPKPKPIAINRNTNKILSTMNSGFGGRRLSTSKVDQDTSVRLEKRKSAVVWVVPSEVLPVICCSKDTNPVKISKLKKISKIDNDENERMPLKFYVVDSRPEAAAQEQGRFPTSLSLSPEKLDDINKMKEEEIMFESLRGSVHICIMGEGYASLPRLYGHKMTNGLAEFIREDDLRNNKCALFFLSRGFPFVSILEGGFAAAHACLCREGPKMGLKVNDVLTDCNPEISVFVQFEKLHSLSGRDKAQRSLHNFFDSGMTALTKNTMRLETLSSEFAGDNIDEQTQQKEGQKNAVQRFFRGRKLQTLRDGTGRSNSLMEESSKSIVAELVELDNNDTSSSSMLHNSPRDQTSPVKVEQNEENSSLDAATNGTQKSEMQHRISQDASSPPAQTKGLAGTFSRFGSLGIGHNVKRRESNSGHSNKIAGSLNTFRKNTMARMRTEISTSDSIESPSEPK